MKKLPSVYWLFPVFMVFLYPMALFAEHEGAHSLRKDVEIQTTNRAAQAKNIRQGKGRVERNFSLQPPLIPHDISGFAINKGMNMCLACHSSEAAGSSGAVKVSITHFTDRDGKKLKNVAPRRYFCTQCHVPQVDAKPLVENTFSN